MRIISVINYKGGTGKTSTVVHLAHGLALQGYRILIVDVDPQGSAGHHLGVNVKRSLYDLITKKEPLSNCIVNARKNLDIICANEYLFPAEMYMTRLKGRELILTKRMMPLKGYDFVFLDCAPSMSLLNQNALLYSDELIVPVSMEYFSLVGVKQLLKNIDIVNNLFKTNVTIKMVVPTFFDKRNKKSKDIVKSIRRVFHKKVATPIRVSVSLSEAPGVKKTVFEYASKSTGAQDYTNLVKEVLASDETTTI
jgi:chromosome partitioning protein